MANTKYTPGASAANGGLQRESAVNRPVRPVTDLTTGQITGLATSSNVRMSLSGTVKDTCVVIGDSRNYLTYAWDSAGRDYRHLGSRSIIAWLQYQSRCQFDFKGIAAVSGWHLTDFISNFSLPNAMSGYAAAYGLGDVDLKTVKWAFVMLGANDLQSWTTSYTTYIDQIIALLSQVEYIVWVGEPAVGAGTNGWGATLPAKRLALNAYLKQLSLANPKLIYIDMEAESLDPLSASGHVATNVMCLDTSSGTVPSVHPTSKFSRVIANKILTTISSRLETWYDPLAQGLLDNYASTPSSTNAFSNSMFNTTGAISGTGALVGTTPTNMSVAALGGATVTGSVVADVFGNAAVFDVTHATPGTWVGVTVTFSTLAADLIAAGNPSQSQFLCDVSWGLGGAGTSDMTAFTLANGADPIAGFYRVKRTTGSSVYRTAYMLADTGHSAGSNVDNTNASHLHTTAQTGILMSPYLDTAGYSSGAYVSGTTNTYATITAYWKTDGSGKGRLVLRRPTVRFIP